MSKKEEKKYEMKEKRYIGELVPNSYHVITLERPHEVIEIKISVKEKQKD